MNEFWKDVPGYKGFYQVSSYGRIRSVDRVIRGGSRGGMCSHRIPGRLLTPSWSGVERHKRLRVKLRKNGSVERKLVHRVVLEAFVGPCPDGMECCHYPDKNPANNRLDNLRWDTPQNNWADRLEHGTDIRGEDVVQAVLTEPQVLQIREMHSFGKCSQVTLAKMFGISQAEVWNIVHRKTWKHL